MKRWVPILVAIRCVMAILGVEPTGAVTNPTTPLLTSSPGLARDGYWDHICLQQPLPGWY
jgi:hypothetical protein